MSAETVTKKRGRPKRTDKVDSTSEIQNGEVITTTKRSMTSRSMSTAKPLSKETVLKKPGRQKKTTGIDDVEASTNQLVGETKQPKSAKEAKFEAGEQLSSSRILNEARAFKELKGSADTPSHINAGASKQPEVSPSGTGLSRHSRLPISTSTRPARKTNLSESSLPSTNPSFSPPPAAVKNDATQSSFLSSFLSDTPDAIPEAPETSKFSDRSAFNSQSPSVDEIVSGTGISDLASLTAAIQQKANAKRERDSAIPITAPKSFKSLGLKTFPDKAERQKVKTPSAQKYVNPEVYALGSFKNFKDNPKATAASSPVIKTSSTDSTTKQSPQIPPTSTLSHIQPNHRSIQHSQKAPIRTSSQTPPILSKNPPPQPPHPFPSRLPQPTPAPTPSEPPFRPKRPTEMTAAELLKNPEFRSLRRKWTGLIVGLPVLVVTSWLLWDRMDRENKGLVLQDPLIVDEKRRRGELPKRILEDGGLERR